MKKYILLGFIFVLSIIVLSNGKYEVYAYKPNTSFQDYVDFDVTFLNNVPFIYEAQSFYNGLSNNVIFIEYLGKQITFKLYEREYEEDILLDSKTFSINQYFYNYSGISYKMDDLISDGDLELKLYDIELIYFDESFYDNIAEFSFIPVTGGNLLPMSQINYFKYQFEMYNYIYSYSNYDSFDNGYGLGYEIGYGHGFNDGIETFNEENTQAFNNGYSSARQTFGMFVNEVWLTAEQYGVLRYDIGYNKGLSNEIDWFSWSMTFFLMPFRIMNIEVLPGVKIGYFALFSLLLGVVGWFFFIVGKGGGRKK